LVGILREAQADVPSQLEEMAMMGGGGGRSKYQLFRLAVTDHLKLIQTAMVVEVAADEAVVGDMAAVAGGAVGEAEVEVEVEVMAIVTMDTVAVTIAGNSPCSYSDDFFPARFLNDLRTGAFRI
jgi:hypothetical protein